MNKESSRRDYNQEEAIAARMVLAELADLLSDYLEAIVIVGGSVPFFMVPQQEFPHLGTKDVDLVIDPSRLPRDPDDSLENILMKALYQQDCNKAFRWEKAIRVDGNWHKVIVDLLTGERGGKVTGMLQRIDDVLVGTIRGCEVAFKAPQQTQWTTKLPDGRDTRVHFQIASAPSFLVMKGLAFHNRDRPETRDDAKKDAYDIYYTVKYFPPGIEVLAAEFDGLKDDPLVLESLRKISVKWRSPNSIGPRYVAELEDDEEAKAILAQDAFQQVAALLRLINFDI